MIATLTGKVAQKLAELVVVDVGGVGYGIFVSADDYGKLKPGQEAKLQIYEHIRENSHDLYGFTDAPTKQLFELLIGVNGIGPRMGLNILSIGNSAEVASSIANGDVKFIQAANGVGKRVAERVVVDLKDKVGITGAESITGIFTSSSHAKKDEAVQALVSLGYTVNDALNALSEISPDLPTDQRVKIALKIKS